MKNKILEGLTRFWPSIGLILLIANYSIFMEGNIATKLFYIAAYPVFLLLCYYANWNWNIKEHVHKLIAKILYGISPFFLFWMMETLGENELNNIEYKYWFGNLIWYIVFIGITLILIRRIKYSIILSFVVTYIIGLANYFVSRFRGVPILPWDIKSATTAMEVANNYSYSLSIYTIWATIILFLFVLTALKLDNDKIKLRTKKSVLILSEYIIMFILVLVVQNTVGVLGLLGGKVYAWRQNIQYRTCGTVISFMENMRFLDIQKPEGYSVDEIEELKWRYTSKEVTVNENRKPNIIAIMDESFSDLSVVKDLNTNEEVMPFIHSLKENTIKGNLHVSVFGGNTCNTEFEFLTGSSMAFLPTGSVPYQQYIDKNTSSLCTTLSAQGYNCKAIHPNLAKNWSRNKVYPYIGFERFYTIDDFYNPQLLRDYVSDKACFDKVIELFEEKEEGQPIFLFNVTMQNHGGYSDYLLPKEITFSQAYKYWRTSVYLNLVKKTDDAFQEFIQYFEQVEEPTLVLFFGDHQPALYDGFYDEINAKADQSIYKNKYVVPFVIWANYDIPEEEMNNISANYLSSYLLKTAELDMTPYQKFLLEDR